MQTQFAAVILAGAMALTGCSKLVSLNTFVAEDEAAVDPALPGIWQDKDGDGLYIVKQAGNSYTITATDKSSTLRLEARLLAAGDLRILDLTAKDQSPCQIPVHVPVRIWLTGNTLRMVFLDSDWLQQFAVQQLGAHVTEGRTVIGSAGATVRDFLVSYASDPKAQGDEQLLLRVQ